MSQRIYSVKEIAKLEKRRFRDEEGVFLIEGKKILSEAKQADVDIIQILATDRFFREQMSFFEEQHIERRAVTLISEHNADRLSEAKSQPGVFAIIKKQTLQLNEVLKDNFIVAVENVRDPGNLGTIIRTADWYGIKSLIISAEGVDPYNDKAIRSTMGSLFHVKIYLSTSFASDLNEVKNAGYALVVTRPESESTFVKKADAKTCLILGNESLGTSEEVDELADFNFALSRLGNAESLNVAVSFGIILDRLMDTDRVLNDKLHTV